MRIEYPKGTLLIITHINEKRIENGSWSSNNSYRIGDIVKVQGGSLYKNKDCRLGFDFVVSKGGYLLKYEPASPALKILYGIS